jgi:hypothetical protein
MSVLVNPIISSNDTTRSTKTSQLDLTEEELEMIDCDTILGLCKFHIFNNSKVLCTWIRNSKIGDIHVLTLANPVGAEVSVNTIDSVFILTSQKPLIKIIFTSKGYKEILD